MNKVVARFADGTKLLRMVRNSKKISQNWLHEQQRDKMRFRVSKDKVMYIGAKNHSFTHLLGAMLAISDQKRDLGDVVYSSLKI